MSKQIVTMNPQPMTTLAASVPIIEETHANGHLEDTEAEWDNLFESISDELFELSDRAMDEFEKGKTLEIGNNACVHLSL